MEHKQHLPSYKKDFEQAEWLQRESPHYSFYYFQNSVAEKDIENIILRQESAFKKITDFLKVPEPKKKIKYYLYPDQKTKEQLMGDDWYAQAIFDDFTVHATYSETDKVIGEHEDTHLLSLPWGLSVNFIQEGLAEYMVGHSWHGENLEQKAKEGFERKVPISIASVMSKQAWFDTPDEFAVYYYAYAGSFVGFLIEKFGSKKFKKFYKNTDREFPAQKNTEIFNSVYGKSLEKVEKAWKEHIKSYCL